MKAANEAAKKRHGTYCAERGSRRSNGRPVPTRDTLQKIQAEYTKVGVIESTSLWPTDAPAAGHRVCQPLCGSWAYRPLPGRSLCKMATGIPTIGRFGRQIAGRLTKLMRPERPEDVVEMAKLCSNWSVPRAKWTAAGMPAGRRGMSCSQHWKAGISCFLIFPLPYPPLHCSPICIVIFQVCLFVDLFRCPAVLLAAPRCLVFFDPERAMAAYPVRRDPPAGGL